MKKYAFYAEDEEDVGAYEDRVYFNEAEREDFSIPWFAIYQAVMQLGVPWTYWRAVYGMVKARTLALYRDYSRGARSKKEKRQAFYRALSQAVREVRQSMKGRDAEFDGAEHEDIPIPWTTLIQLALRLYVIHKQVDLRNLVRLAARYYRPTFGTPPSLVAQRALARAAGQLGLQPKRVRSQPRGLSRHRIRQYQRRQDQRPRRRYHSRAYWR